MSDNYVYGSNVDLGDKVWMDCNISGDSKFNNYYADINIIQPNGSVRLYFDENQIENMISELNTIRQVILEQKNKV